MQYNIIILRRLCASQIFQQTYGSSNADVGHALAESPSAQCCLPAHIS